MLSYLGSIDDAVLRIGNQPPPTEIFNGAMLYAALFGDPLLINDGYLLHEQIARQLFMAGNSPLMRLVEAQHVYILSRNGGELASMPEQMANKVDSYSRLTEHNDWPEIKRGLLEVQKRIAAYNGFIRWPTFDLSDGFTRLASDLFEQRGWHKRTSHIDSGVLHRVRDEFLAVRSSRPDAGARTVWEAAVDALYKNTNSPRRIELLELGNEIYHYNFALLASGNLENRSDEINLYSYNSNRLSEFRHAAPASDGQRRSIGLRLPGQANNEALLNPDFLSAVLEDTGTLRQSRDEFRDILQDPTSYNPEICAARQYAYQEQLVQCLDKSLFGARDIRISAFLDAVATAGEHATDLLNATGFEFVAYALTGTAKGFKALYDSQPAVTTATNFAIKGLPKIITGHFILEDRYREQMDDLVTPTQIAGMHQSSLFRIDQTLAYEHANRTNAYGAS